VYRNYIRNQSLIDLEKIPTEIKTAIVEKFETSERPKRKDLYKYFVEKKLTRLLDVIEDFQVT
jgi:hypothetical protein